MAGTSIAMVIINVLLVFATHDLINADLRPNISISEVHLEMIDDTGTPRRHYNSRVGEMLNGNGDVLNLSAGMLTVRFSNSGKQAGFVELSNYRELMDKFENQQLKTEKGTRRVLVPGGGESGLEYEINVGLKMGRDDSWQEPYKLVIYDMDGSDLERKTFYIYCEFPWVATGGVNAKCVPRYYAELEPGSLVTTSLPNKSSGTEKFNWSVVVAGILGAVIALLGTHLQSRAQRVQAIDERQYNARREAFEAGLCLFHFISMQRWDGIHVAPTDSSAEKYAGYNTMGRLGLHASRKLMNQIFKLLALLDQSIPIDKEKRGQDKEQITSQRNLVVDLMRDELGS